MARRWLRYEDVVSVAGEDVARAVTRVFGGMSMYLPVAADGANPLEPLMGREVLRRFCLRYGGGHVVFSKRQGSRKNEIIARLERGQTSHAIAADLDVTLRYVQRLASDVRCLTEGGAGNGRGPAATSA